ncbi:MAG: trypsin-like peptidase domain-containing protein [Bryobacteraceae bacterium]|jgi:serine protease Do
MRGLGEVAERLRRSTVQVRSLAGRGSGSGVIWSGDGLVLTNAHVARSADLEVELWDGRRLPARVLARDPRRDLASLRVAAASLEAASAGNSASLRPGELVMAVGSPLGFAGAVSTGVIHSLGPIRGMGEVSWIRAQVRLAPGNSGGPLANAEGRVIGINTAVVNGLGLAVPSDDAADFVRRGARPSLGVTLRPVSAGALILDVEPDGAAAMASLKTGDLLLMSVDELYAALDSGQPALRLRFMRGAPSGGRLPVRETVVRLGERVAEAA